jgi:hypothetical protein
VEDCVTPDIKGMLDLQGDIQRNESLPVHIRQIVEIFAREVANIVTARPVSYADVDALHAKLSTVHRAIQEADWEAQSVTCQLKRASGVLARLERLVESERMVARAEKILAAARLNAAEKKEGKA